MKINVLDHGYVRLVDVLGSDLSVVNAARVSYDKESLEFSERDEKLLAFLVREGHTSPFRHAALTFEVHAPLIIARQWYKHAVASTYLDDQNGWNESSRRYVTETPEFYIPGPNEWRGAPENKKQGSKDTIAEGFGQDLTEDLESYIRLGSKLYDQAMNLGVAAEQARLFLPAYALYVRWRWTASLAAVIHFLSLRDESHAQVEIQQFAKAVKELTQKAFPKSIEAFDRS